MLAKIFRHKQYVRFVRNRAGRNGGLRSNHRHYAVWRKLSKTNLDGAYSLLKTLYAVPARDPVSMLRSCLAMMEWPDKFR
ncbi:hypothetical protein KFU94_63500 [Chloroflexi bacterium TSY]|nr:hypothetical protein [Chloroflexi bacterium TSY]